MRSVSFILPQHWSDALYAGGVPEFADDGERVWWDEHMKNLATLGPAYQLSEVRRADPERDGWMTLWLHEYVYVASEDG